jgi:hypothetical protein
VHDAHHTGFRRGAQDGISDKVPNPSSATPLGNDAPRSGRTSTITGNLESRILKRRSGKYPRFVMHFTPTGASWLHMVKRFFRDISESRINRDSFTSVAELAFAIELCVARHDPNPEPFMWTASASDIPAKVTRTKAAAVERYVRS